MRQFPEAMPLIIVDTDASPEADKRIKSFDESIRREPEAYLEALDTLGDELIDPTLSVLEQVTLPRTISTDISSQIINFFFERDDKVISYDKATEQQIRTNEEHQRLLADFKTINQTAVRVGQDNVEANNARDAVRLSSLRLYIGRVVSFQAQQQAESVEAVEGILINT